MKKLDFICKIITAGLVLVGIALLILINTTGVNNESSQPMITKLVQYYLIGTFIITISINICRLLIKRNKKS